MLEGSPQALYQEGFGEVHSWLGSQYPQALAASGHRGHPLLPGPLQKLLQSKGPAGLRAAGLAGAPPCPGFMVTSCPQGSSPALTMQTGGAMEGRLGAWADSQGRCFLGELDRTHWLLFVLCGRSVECSSQAAS